MINQQISWIRRIILIVMVGLFLVLCGLFLKQIRQHSQVEKSLEKAYSFSLSNSQGIDKLYHVFNEADMVFRMFTLDFDRQTFEIYQTKMDSVYALMDCLNESAGEDIDSMGLINFQVRNQYLQEFANLRKILDSLLVHSEMANLEINNFARSQRSKKAKSDSLIKEIIVENSSKTISDTVVTKKQGLFKRIFNPSQDTIIINNKDMEKTRDRLLGIIETNEVREQPVVQKASTSSEIGNIRSTFRQLQSKEQQLIINTHEILSAIEASIDRLKLLELSEIRRAENKDFEIYKETGRDINRQFLLSLTVMGILILILIYYQWNASKMEKKLLKEVRYSNTIAKEKTEVLASISHEVRTPLNSILHISKILKSDPEITKNEDKKLLLESIYYNVERTSNTVNDILMLSKMEEKNGDVSLYARRSPSYFNVKQCLVDTIKLHRNQAEFKSIQLVENLENVGDLMIKSDAFPIRQAVSNFLSNALIHTPSGGKISIAAQFAPKDPDGSKGGILTVQVDDTGTGIAKKHQQNIFRKYYTSNASTGFGLGLYISKKLIEGLNGKIGFKSEVDQGSSFYIQLPIEEYNFENFSASHDHLHTDIDHPAVLTTLSPFCMLSVDDNPINLLIIRHFFRNTPHTLLESTTIADAKTRLAAKQVHVIITDINLPDGSGWELLEFVKTHPDYKHIKILSTSASLEALERPDNLESTEGLDLNFDGTLPKPFVENDLWSVLAKALSGRP